MTGFELSYQPAKGLDFVPLCVTRSRLTAQDLMVTLLTSPVLRPVAVAAKRVVKTPSGWQVQR